MVEVKVDRKNVLRDLHIYSVIADHRKAYLLDIGNNGYRNNDQGIATCMSFRTDERVRGDVPDLAIRTGIQTRTGRNSPVWSPHFSRIAATIPPRRPSSLLHISLRLSCEARSNSTALPPKFDLSAMFIPMISDFRENDNFDCGIFIRDTKRYNLNPTACGI